MKSVKEKAFMGRQKDKGERRLTVIYHTFEMKEKAKKEPRMEALRYKPCPILDEFMKNLA